jgi:predicted RNA binding protein YcfA (HicA-like mRNA interferase family)
MSGLFGAVRRDLGFRRAGKITMPNPLPPLPSPASSPALLREDGFFLLREDGSHILLELSSALLREDGFYLLREDLSHILMEA